MFNSHLVFIFLLAVVVILIIILRKLTVTAALTGGLIAVLLYAGPGMGAIALMGSFFILGTTVTSVGYARKAAIGIAEERHGMRDVYQVLANGGAAGMLGVLACFFPEHGSKILLMIACGFSSATADTVSSELGTIYGKRFVNVLSFRPDRRGENGVVSIEGFLSGIAGSLLIGLVYCAFTDFKWASLLIIIIAGTLGNICDSILGATLEREGMIGNNAVNFLNTLTGILIGAL